MLSLKSHGANQKINLDLNQWFVTSPLASPTIMIKVAVSHPAEYVQTMFHHPFHQQWTSAVPCAPSSNACVDCGETWKHAWGNQSLQGQYWNWHQRFPSSNPPTFANMSRTISAACSSRSPAQQPITSTDLSTSPSAWLSILVAQGCSSSRRTLSSNCRRASCSYVKR